MFTVPVANRRDAPKSEGIYMNSLRHCKRSRVNGLIVLSSRPSPKKGEIIAPGLIKKLIIAYAFPIGKQTWSFPYFLWTRRLHLLINLGVTCSLGGATVPLIKYRRSTAYVVQKRSMHC